MKKNPSRRFPTHVGNDPELFYVADSESDAQALHKQLGGLVDIRRRVVEEIPYGPTFVRQTFQPSRRLSRLNVPGVKSKSL
jgi:hypothetical protein